MIIVLRSGASDADVADIEKRVRELGYEPHTIRGVVRTVVAAVGDETTHESLEALVNLPVVENVMPVQKKFKLISRETHPESMVIRVGRHEIGGGTFHVIAGPCSVETPDQMMYTAERVKESGATMLRGGAYKPRTSPYAFQGLGEEGLAILDQVKKALDMPVVTEVTSEGGMERVLAVADVLQIGARNALNYALLEAAAETGRPILLKRGIAATTEEWLLAAEYIVKGGNRNVILCERGIRTFETATRNTLDLSAVAIAKKETTLPVFVDPSHAAGRWDLITDLSKAAVAVGADGLMIEVHRHPEAALSDGAQQITPDVFSELMKEIRPFVTAAGKKMAATKTDGAPQRARPGWGR
ncbi:MAG: 3-deoxy-7-phosphoheptulonate synthase [Kiritimatiellae bacterium]|nr:3-deoxy-7-phosphoheptulonate synthase [Kiritimatiellia bacterium]